MTGLCDDIIPTRGYLQYFQLLRKVQEWTILSFQSQKSLIQDLSLQGCLFLIHKKILWDKLKYSL